MSYESTAGILSVLHDEVNWRYQHGRPIAVAVNGRPQLHIWSLRPLVYDRYGSFLNQAPYVSGQLALRGFLWSPGTDGGAAIYSAMDTGIETYGFFMNPQNQTHMQTLQGIAEYVSHPMLHADFSNEE